MESGKKKVLIIAIISCVLLLLVGGYFVVTKVILNNNETETNKETITLELGVSTSLSQYIENIDEVENAVFEKTDIFSINAEYLITTLKEGTDSLVVTYTDGTNEILTFKAVEVKEVTIGLTEKVYLGDYVENLENIKSTSFTEEDIFTLENNYIVANHAGISELNITYKDNSMETIRLYCNVGRIELEVGQTVNLSDYVEDIAAVSSATVNDPSVFLIENNTVKALAEGSAILTVTYNDGTTELFDLVCAVKTSNASNAVRLKVLKNNGSSSQSYYYIYATVANVRKVQTSTSNTANEYNYRFYSDASLTKRIFQLDLGYTTSNGTIYQEVALRRDIKNNKFNQGLYGYFTIADSRGILDNTITGDYYKLKNDEVITPIVYTDINNSIYKITLNAHNYSSTNEILYYQRKGWYNYVYANDDNTNTHFYNQDSFNSPSSVERVAITKIKTPVRTGYSFGGYYTLANGQGTQVIDAKGNINTSVLKQNANTTLHAKWIRNGNGYRGY